MSATRPSSAVVERLEVHRDARGSVFEPLEPSRIPGQRNVHVVVTEPGGVRGNHRHERSTEVLTVVGPALVRLREGPDVRDVEVPAGEAFRFVLPPGVGHAVWNTGPLPNVLVSFRDAPHDPERPDVVREVLIDVGA